MATIELQHLRKSFPSSSGAPMPVLDDFCLTVEHNEFVCLLGPSGCGKSTTLDVLAGLTTPDSGQVSVEGKLGWGDLTVGYVFQRPRLLNWRTVRQNVELAVAARGVPAQECRSRAEKYLELVHLREFADVFPLTLSGGMQQRVAIARALAIEPDVLLMDEPFSSLDELTARTMRMELLELVGRLATTVLFVTHNALEAAFLADRICVVSRRPATVVAELPIDAARPRRPEDPHLISVQQRVLELLSPYEAPAAVSEAAELPEVPRVSVS
jgi:ABC-type nitrate/sulfonate/bicarbonate transport system ATPase subunit